MMKDRVNFVKELWPLCSFFFIPPTEYDEKTVRKRWKPNSAAVMNELSALLEQLDDFSIENQEREVMAWVERRGYKLGDVMNAFRLALVGIGKGPGRFDISAFLGKDETLSRLRRCIWPGWPSIAFSTRRCARCGAESAPPLACSRKR